MTESRTSKAEAVPSRQVHHAGVLARLRDEMGKQELDLLLATGPENFYYVAGWPSFWLNSSRLAGMAVAVLPCDARLRPVLVVSEFEFKTIVEQALVRDVRAYPIWIYVDDSRLPAAERITDATRTKPQFFDLALCLDVVQEILCEKGLAGARIGVDSRSMPQTSWQALQRILGQGCLVQADDVFLRCRSIKSKWEVHNLRQAARSAEEALLRVVETTQPGDQDGKFKRQYLLEALADAHVDDPGFILVSVGDDFAPSEYPTGAILQPGDLLRFDYGVLCRGYHSDMARTFVLGASNEEQRRIHAALMAGHMAGLEQLQPGKRLCEVFQAAMAEAQRQGLPDYRRGHVGHSIGLSHTIEEPPFLSPQEETVLQPGMVVCLELPYFAYGFGAMQVEDMVLITEDGQEVLSHASRDLCVL